MIAMKCVFFYIGTLSKIVLGKCSLLMIKYGICHVLVYYINMTVSLAFFGKYLYSSMDCVCIFMHISIQSS